MVGVLGDVHTGASIDDYHEVIVHMVGRPVFHHELGDPKLWAIARKAILVQIPNLPPANRGNWQSVVVALTKVFGGDVALKGTPPPKYDVGDILTYARSTGEQVTAPVIGVVSQYDRWNYPAEIDGHWAYVLRTVDRGPRTVPERRLQLAAIPQGGE